MSSAATAFDAGAKRLAEQLRATADVLELGTADKLASDEKVLTEVTRSVLDSYSGIEDFDDLLGALSLTKSRG